MACETRIRRNQTRAQRIKEVQDVATKVERGIASGKVKVTVGKQNGAVTFTGLTNEDRADVTDACIYRRILVSGSAQTRLAIKRAEMIAGRTISGQAVNQVHSHDGGITWHDNH